MKTTLLIFTLLIIGVQSQYIFKQEYSYSVSGTVQYISFSPNDTDIFLATTNFNFNQIINLLSSSQNKITNIQTYYAFNYNYNYQYGSGFGKAQTIFFPKNGNKAVGINFPKQLNMYSVSQSSITKTYGLSLQSDSKSISLNPSGTHSVINVFNQNQLTYLNMEDSSIRVISQSYTQNLVDEMLFLNDTYFITTSYQQNSYIQQYILTENSINFLKEQKATQVIKSSAIVSFNENNNLGIISSGSYCDLILFYYDLDQPGFNINILQNVLFSKYSICTYFAINKDQSKIIIADSSSLNLIIKDNQSPNCKIIDLNGYCSQCEKNYQPINGFCKKIECQKRCNTCTSTNSCQSCVQSTPARVLEQLCACPPGTYDDGLNVQCQPCSNLYQGCATCNATQCFSCVGTANKLSSRLLPTCKCAELGYYDAINVFEECQECASPYCLTCSNSFQCTSCISQANQTYSRIMPGCNCPLGYVDSKIGNTCIKQECQAPCRTCQGSQCLTCIGSENQPSSRLLSDRKCHCPPGYTDLDRLEECIKCQNPLFAECQLGQRCIGSALQESSRLLGKNCSCPQNGFYDAFPQQHECQKCKSKYCLTCSEANSCTSCTGTPNLPSSRLLPNCDCPSGFVSFDQFSQDCLPEQLFTDVALKIETKKANTSFYSSLQQHLNILVYIFLVILSFLVIVLLQQRNKLRRIQTMQRSGQQQQIDESAPAMDPDALQQMQIRVGDGIMRQHNNKQLEMIEQGAAIQQQAHVELVESE